MYYIFRSSIPLSMLIFCLFYCTKSNNNSAGSGGTGTTPVSDTLPDQFARISDSVLLDKIESQTLKYFTDFAHPTSVMARERNTSGDVVTTGGTGFGIMAIIVGANRGFISKTEAFNQIYKITNFLLNSASRYHGAFAHWINGATGATVPFSSADNGADIVETSYLMEGLLTARQYFNGSSSDEISLRNNINTLWNGVDWTWFQKGGLSMLYWNWSSDQGWAVNVAVQGWNEALITYILAASSNSYAIDKSVYSIGWAQNGAMKNGNIYYNTVLPLGPTLGGPLFFSHYSFLGLNPKGLSDTYANYWQQDTAHAHINYAYCVANPNNYKGYSIDCWGLTASDNKDGYDAQSPINDNGTISPTAAVSSLPYVPNASMRAIKYFYYKLGNKIWGDYGFVDAFNQTQSWYATSYLAIDQGPQIVMIENYRSGLVWNLFMSCPEIQNGLQKLGFTATK